MLFPPYIAQPCQLSCCRPMSSSVPRYSAAQYNNNNNFHANALRRRNSFTLTNDNHDFDIDEDECCNDLIPPRPPELLVNNRSSNEVPKRLTSYEMIPIIKPASSMPNGLPQTQPLSNDMASRDDEILLSDGTESHYRSSQPNIMMTSYRSNSRGTNRTDNISNLTASTTLASSTLSNLTGKSSNTAASGGAMGGLGGGSNTNSGGLGLSSYGNNNGSGPLSSSRYGSRATSIEPRTAAYYYHELAQKSAIFDSNLNLLNDNKNDNTIPTTIAETVNTTKQQQQHALPRQQLLNNSNSDGHKLSSFNGSLDNVLETTRKNLDDLILSTSLLYNAHSSNDLLNYNNNNNNNGNSSSAGTLVDDDDNHNNDNNHINNFTHNSNNPIPAARKNILSSNTIGYLKRSSQNLLHHSSSNSNILNSNNNTGSNHNNNGNIHNNNNNNSLNHG